MPDGDAGMEVDQWNRSVVETEWNWMSLSGLQSGTTYEVRVVAVTDTEHESRSQTRGVMIGSIPGMRYECNNNVVVCQ